VCLGQDGGARVTLKEHMLDAELGEVYGEVETARCGKKVSISLDSSCAEGESMCLHPPPTMTTGTSITSAIFMQSSSSRNSLNANAV
jgi:hypothetical protein